jgi:NAD(P)-dependent dehydrogenase (short-subunit alcohol dehydrogenase family)
MGATRGLDAASMVREFFANARPSSVIKRFATPYEVASMIAYVCSTQASATTGAALRVDGGVVRALRRRLFGGRRRVALARSASPRGLHRRVQPDWDIFAVVP